LHRNLPVAAETEHISEPIWLYVQSPVQIVRTPWNFGKPGVVAVHEPWKKRIGSLHVTDACQSQFLDQTVLQGAVRSLDTTFGLRAVCAEDLDI